MKGKYVVIKKQILMYGVKFFHYFMFYDHIISICVEENRFISIINNYFFIQQPCIFNLLVTFSDII